jgi:apoptosis-inducing factor 3
MSQDVFGELRDLSLPISLNSVPNVGLLVGKVGKERVFVCRQGSKLFAYSASCPHLGAPLDKGIVADGALRCPWHHACFDLASGDAIAAPAFGPLTRFPVLVGDDQFSVGAPQAAALKPPSEFKPAAKRQRDLETMAIVGAGAAGFAAADALRKCLVPAFDGASLSSDSKDALWARFFMGAPRRQRRSVERYNIVKRA